MLSFHQHLTHSGPGTSWKCPAHLDWKLTKKTERTLKKKPIISRCNVNEVCIGRARILEPYNGAFAIKENLYGPVLGETMVLAQIYDSNFPLYEIRSVMGGCWKKYVKAKGKKAPFAVIAPNRPRKWTDICRRLRKTLDCKFSAILSRKIIRCVL